MTLYVVPGGRYDRRMATLPFPARRLTLSEINADYRKYLAELEQGGAILVVSDDEQAFLGVLTRAPAVLGDAQLAQLIETRAVPTLGRLRDAPSHARGRGRPGGCPAARAAASRANRPPGALAPHDRVRAVPRRRRATRARRS